MQNRDELVAALVRRIYSNMDDIGYRVRSIREGPSGLFVWRTCTESGLVHEVLIEWHRLKELVHDGMFADKDERDFLVSNVTPMEYHIAHMYDDAVDSDLPF